MSNGLICQSPPVHQRPKLLPDQDFVRSDLSIQPSDSKTEFFRKSLSFTIVTIIKRKFHSFVLLSVCLICFCFSHVQMLRLSTESMGLSMVFQRESLFLIRLSRFFPFLFVIVFLLK